jgi:hypothetical protein
MCLATPDIPERCWQHTRDRHEIAFRGGTATAEACNVRSRRGALCKANHCLKERLLDSALAEPKREPESPENGGIDLALRMRIP